eukprot:scaffold82870_cov48-Attheya_sp.AAC.4
MAQITRTGGNIATDRRQAKMVRRGRDCWGLLLVFLASISAVTPRQELFTEELQQLEELPSIQADASQNNILYDNFSLETRIIGGQDADAGRYPSIVSLVNVGYQAHVCGGTLIASDMVLTAAHCKGSFGQVRTGVHRLNDSVQAKDRFSLNKLWVHPEYDTKNLGYDIMLVKLSGKASQTPIRLNFDGNIPTAENDNISVIGFGVKENGGSTSNVLQEAKVLYIPNDECDKKKYPYNSDFSYEGLIMDNMMCAADDGKDACQGDSGGPLILSGATPGDDVQLGIVAWGFSCADPFLPGVYTRISAEKDWIRQVVCENSADPPAQYECATALTPAPTPTPPDYAVTLVVQLDQFPADTAWIIESMPGSDRPLRYVKMAASYDPYELVSNTFYLYENEKYRLTLDDAFNDGICCDQGTGSYKLYRGTEANIDNLILSHRGDYGSGREHCFIAGEDQLQCELSNTQAFEVVLIVVIQFDGFPNDIGWRLESMSSTASPREENIGFVSDIKNVPMGSYSNTLANNVVIEKVTVPVIGNDVNFKFTIADNMGDGLCCRYGTGFYRLYEREVTPDNLLYAGSGLFGNQADYIFSLQSPAPAPTDNQRTPSPTVSRPYRPSFGFQGNSSSSAALHMVVSFMITIIGTVTIGTFFIM